jgi:hypothetical protein
MTMADMHHVVEVDGVDAASTYAALTTDDITGWWTSRGGVTGDRVGACCRRGRHVPGS